MDINDYIKKSNFDEQQLGVISAGLTKGLDVSTYANEKFDFWQMIEIFIGLNEGLDVTVYNKEFLSSKKMHSIRVALLKGLDLTGLFETPLSEKRVNFIIKVVSDGNRSFLTKYNDYGLSTEKLTIIYETKNFKKKIDEYILSPNVSDSLANEIYKAFLVNPDLSEVLTSDYDDGQKIELLKAIEEGVDVSLMLNPQLWPSQMRQVRLGLVHNLEVDYADPLLSVSEMKYRRSELQNEYSREKDIEKIKLKVKEQERRILENIG